VGKLVLSILILLLVGCERTVYPDTPPPTKVDLPTYPGNDVFLEGDDWWDSDDDDIGGD